MTEPTPDPTDIDPDLADPPIDDERAAKVASDQFMHGLLTFLHRDTKLAQEQRLQRMLTALDDGVAPPKTFRFPTLRVATGLAAMVAIVLIVVLATPASRTAMAVVESSIAASRDAGDRRYTMRVVLPHEDEGAPGSMIGDLDVRDPEHFVFRMRTPDGHDLVFGRDGRGRWSIRRDGAIERLEPQRAVPRFVEFGDNTLLTDSLDQHLAYLLVDYQLDLLEPEPRPGGADGRTYDRISATLLVADDADTPGEVELWIDPRTDLVHRLELRWTEVQVPSRDAHEARRERGDFERRPGRRPDGKPKPPRDWHGGGPDDRFGGPPDKPRGPGKRGGRGERHRPPPRLIVFEWVDVDPFNETWFEPESHLPSIDERRRR